MMNDSRDLIGKTNAVKDSGLPDHSADGCVPVTIPDEESVEGIRELEWFFLRLSSRLLVGKLLEEDRVDQDCDCDADNQCEARFQ